MAHVESLSWPHEKHMPRGQTPGVNWFPKSIVEQCGEFCLYVEPQRPELQICLGSGETFEVYVPQNVTSCLYRQETLEQG